MLCQRDFLWHSLGLGFCSCSPVRLSVPSHRATGFCVQEWGVRFPRPSEVCCLPWKKFREAIAAAEFSGVLSGRLFAALLRRFGFVAAVACPPPSLCTHWEGQQLELTTSQS